MLWVIEFVLGIWTGCFLLGIIFSKEYRESIFPPRSTWGERAGSPQEDMTEKEYRAWKRNNE